MLRAVVPEKGAICKGALGNFKDRICFFYDSTLLIVVFFIRDLIKERRRRKLFRVTDNNYLFSPQNSTEGILRFHL